MPALSNIQKAKAKDLFNLYDDDHSGRVNVNELATLMRAMGFTPTNNQVKTIVGKYDKNNDGRLSYAEFEQMLIQENIAPHPTEDEIREAFRVFDKNNSGTISKTELKAAMMKHGEPMSEAEVDNMIRQFDSDGDGKINYNEFARMSGAAAKNSVRGKINWDDIRAKLPTDRTEAAKTKRHELYRRCDPNGNGYLSLAEVDKGVRDELKLDTIFDVKPVLMRAFQAAKQINNARGTSKHGPDYIEFAEFRLLLVYLRNYFEVWQMFDDVDTCDDRRIDVHEFSKGLKKLESWGLKHTDAEQEFNAIDTNRGGQILFDEFADWALKKKLDLTDDDDFNEAAPHPENNTSAHHADAASTANKKDDGAKPAGAAHKPAKAMKVRSNIDWPGIRAKLPMELDGAQKTKRQELFRRCDVNGNGYLSLAEVDKALRDVLELDAIFNVKPVIIRAFNASKNVQTTRGKASTRGADFIEASEFRLLLVYLRQYFEVWQMFEDVDSGDDHRIDLAEFKNAIKKIESWGLKIGDDDNEFRALDTNNGGQILFDEFTDWALKKKLDLENDDD